MASIPASVIMIWTGSNATIPTGWTRETTLDEKFPKGAAASTQGGTNAGATTHTHTSPTHTHTINAHTHTVVLESAGATTSGCGDLTRDAILDTHTHEGTSGAASGGTTGTTVITYGSVSNNPPCRKVIYIKSNGGSQLATNMVALYNSNTPPTNWSNVTELSGRFMLGAATGADADLSTDNGSSTNVHSINHSHTSNTHTHAQSTIPQANAPRGDGLSTGVYQYHQHTISLNAGTSTIPDYSGNLTTAETVEPVYAILQAIKKSASGLKAIGIIGMWLESIVSIPRGWVLCNGSNSTKDLREKHIKIGDPAGANGGSNTHTHASQNHTHNNPATHNHTGTPSAHVDMDNILVSASSSTHRAVAGSVHPATIGNTVAAYAATGTTADSSSNEPAYRTVNFIQFQKEVSNGTFLFNMM